MGDPRVAEVVVWLVLLPWLIPHHLQFLRVGATSHHGIFQSQGIRKSAVHCIEHGRPLPRQPPVLTRARTTLEASVLAHDGRSHDFYALSDDVVALKFTQKILDQEYPRSFWALRHHR